MRLLPANQDLTLANFNSFDINGENIVTNVGSKQLVVKKEFYVKKNTKKGEKHKLNIEVIEPVEEASLCAKNIFLKEYETVIPIQIAAVSSDKDFGYSDQGKKFEIKLTLDRYVSDGDNWTSKNGIKYDKDKGFYLERN